MWDSHRCVAENWSILGEAVQELLKSSDYDRTVGCYHEHVNWKVTDDDAKLSVETSVTGEWVWGVEGLLVITTNLYYGNKP
jgi:hypothetical protein